MYIEVLHDTAGDILGCYQADTLPVNPDIPLFELEKMPPDSKQVRINIDTVTAMEINQACGQQAVIDPVSGKPVIVIVDRADYIRQNFTVDIGKDIPLPATVKIPTGMKMRGLNKKV